MHTFQMCCLSCLHTWTMILCIIYNNIFILIIYCFNNVIGTIAHVTPLNGKIFRIILIKSQHIRSYVLYCQSVII